MLGPSAGCLGHANPATTLRIYTNQFAASDADAAAAIERALKGGKA
jgi:hypothetical protein